jgi:hypothetical protein
LVPYRALAPLPGPVDHLRPADPEAVAASLYHRLRYQDRRRAYHADTVMLGGDGGSGWRST